MPTNFPTALDTFENPTPTSDTAVLPHSDQHANANDAIAALQVKVGIDESADTDSLDYRVTALEESGGGGGYPVMPRLMWRANNDPIGGTLSEGGFGAHAPSTPISAFSALPSLSGSIAGTNYALLAPAQFHSAALNLGGGFRVQLRFVVSDNWAQEDVFFVGLTYSAASQLLDAVDGLDFMADCIGVAGDPDLANYQVVHNDSSGAPTLVDSGISINADDIVDVTITRAAGASGCTVAISVVGRTTFSTSPSTNLPSATTALLVRAETLAVDTGAGQLGFVSCDGWAGVA